MIRPQVILFDLDNTVYAYAPCHKKGLEEAAAICSGSNLKGVDFETAYDRARRSVKKQVGNVAASHCRLLYFKSLIEDQAGRSDLDLASRLHNAYWSGYFSAMTIEPGAKALFDQLRADGVKTSWVTDFTTERQIQKLNHLGLGTAVDLLVTSEEAGADKPDPRIVDLALSRLKAENLPGWFVGDDVERDLQPGKERGLASIWFTRFDEPEPEPASIALADATVRGWEALKRLYDES